MGALVSGPEKTRRQALSAFPVRRAGREPARGGVPSAGAVGPQRVANVSDISIHAQENVSEGWRSPGVPLDSGVRHRMEPHFGNLERVRVHADAPAAASAEAIGAAAFTWKDHMVFAGGRYSPDTWAGQNLLAHELVHVAQQRGAGDEGAEVAERDDPLERNARAVLAGNAAPEAASSAMVQRQGADEPLPPVSLGRRPKPEVRLGGKLSLPLLDADVQRLLGLLGTASAGAVASAPRVQPGQQLSPAQIADLARSLVLPVFQRPDTRQFAVDAYLRTRTSPDLTLHAGGPPPDQPSGLQFADVPPLPAKPEGDKPDVSHQTTVGYDPQNTFVRGAPRVRGSGVGVVVDQAAVQWNASAYELSLHKGATPAGNVTLSVLTQPTVQATTEGFPQPAAPNNSNVPSNVQQGSIAAGGSLAALQVGTDKNPRLSVTVGQVTAGPQSSATTPSVGGPPVAAPTQFILGITPLQIEATVHTFGDGSRLGVGITGGFQVGVSPGQSPVINLAPTGAFLTFHLP